MRSGIRTVMAAAVAASLAGGVTAANVPWEERSAVERVWYTAGAVVANLTPVSALYAPRCLPGYLLCKLSFAGASVLAAADQLAFSGGADLAQTRAILHRGFAGDWVLTPRHVAREATPEPLPEPPHPAAGGHVHALDDLAEDGVADAVLGSLLVEERIVLHVDEELRRGAVGNRGAGHRHRPGLVLEPVARFVLDRRLLPFPLVLHVGSEPAALDHEARDDAVEDRAVVVAGLGVVEEVLDRDRCLVGVELELDVTHRCRQRHHGVLLCARGYGGPERDYESQQRG